MTLIRLIRHGQASFGLSDYDQLSELGVEQARMLGRSLRRRAGEVDRVICGGMRRHLQTAEAVLEAMRLDIEPEIDVRWNEFDHEQVIIRQKPAYRSRGVMVADLTRKGDPRHQFQLFFDAALERWTSSLHDDYAETWPAFSARVLAGLDALTADTGPAENVLVFTSGGPVSAVAADLFGLDSGGWMKLNRTCANCSETKVVSGRSGVSLVTWNAHPWFDSDRSFLSYR